MKNYLNTTSLAEYFGVSKQAVADWRKIGLNYQDLGPRTKLYNVHEVNEWLKNRGSQKAKKEVE